MAKKRLWEIVEDLDTDVLTLIKLAKGKIFHIQLLMEMQICLEVS